MRRGAAPAAAGSTAWHEVDLGRFDGPGAQSALAAGLPVVVTRSHFAAGEAMPARAGALLDGLGEPGTPAPWQALGWSFRK